MDIQQKQATWGTPNEDKQKHNTIYASKHKQIQQDIIPPGGINEANIVSKHNWIIVPFWKFLNGV